MKIIIILTILLTILCPSFTYAKRKAPKDVKPIIHNNIQYIAAPNSKPFWEHYKDDKYQKILNKRNKGAYYIESWDMNENKLLWELKIYEVIYDKNRESDVQDIFITNMKLKDNILTIWNEKNDRFIVNLKTKEINPKNKKYKKKFNF